MALTEVQRAARRHHLGSSDAAAILGLDPWRNAGDVYWSKVLDTADEESTAMRAGNLLEGAICQFAAQELVAAELRFTKRIHHEGHEDHEEWGPRITLAGLRKSHRQ